MMQLLFSVAESIAKKYMFFPDIGFNHPKKLQVAYIEALSSMLVGLHMFFSREKGTDFHLDTFQFFK